jgi:hypothetical protein
VMAELILKDGEPCPQWRLPLSDDLRRTRFQ